MLTIETIKAQLNSHKPTTPATKMRHAAVALLLTDTAEGPEVLFIRRAEYTGDPWSGDVAFPGGGIETQDSSPRKAAERETWEEIGLRLNARQYLGQLDDLHGAYLPIQVSCFLYLLTEKPQLKLNGEVVTTFWMPLRELQAAERNQEKTFAYRDSNRTHPIINLNGYCDHFLWGISYRILQQLFSLNTPR